jgi:hypothetical protein
MSTSRSNDDRWGRVRVRIVIKPASGVIRRRGNGSKLISFRQLQANALEAADAAWELGEGE